MMEAKDWISFLVGAVVFCLGAFPLLHKFGIGPAFFDLSKYLSGVVVSAIIAVAGLYCVIDAVIELTNSNSIGWVTILIGFIAIIIGVMPLLANFGIGPEFLKLEFMKSFGPMLFNVVLMIEGLFLMIAMFAMEM